MPDQEADEDIVSDPELITRVRAGDRSAFGELYRRHSGPATTLSRQFARSAAESDDLVSESFARVLDNLLSGKGPDTAFRAYLFTTIRNTAYDRTRKDKKLQFTDDMTAHDVAVVGEDPVLAKMESGLVATAFAQLPERWQAVLWHTQVEGESPAKVGAMLGMAPGAVSSLAFRAREGLREAYLQAHLAETAAEQCRKTVESLGAWTRGGLSKREKAQVDAHLETCDRCRALAAELEEVNSGLRGLLAPLLLGGAAVGYLATLGPVAPLAAPGTLVAGAGAAGAGAGSTGGSTAGGGTAAGAGAGTGGGAAGAGTGAAAAGGSAAATTGAAAAAGAAAVAAGAVGATAYASGQAGGSAAGGSAGGGSAGGGAGGAAAGGAAAGAGAGGAAAGGLAGVIASMGVGGLVAAGAAVLVAAVAAVVFVVSGNSPETSTAADQQGAGSQSAAAGSAGAGASGAAGSSAAGSGSAAAGAGASGAAGSSAGSGSAAAGAGASGAAATGDQPADAQPAASVAEPVPNGGTPPGGDVAGAGSTTNGEILPVVATTEDSVPSTDQGPPPAPATDTPTETPATDTPSTQTPPTDTPSTQTPPSETSVTSNPPTSPPLTPFTLVVSGLTAPALTAGGTGSASATIANTGDQAAPGPVLTVTVPTGVQVTGVDVAPGGPALRRSALLAPVPCAPAGPLTCTSDLPDIAGHSSLLVTVSLSATPTAADGSVSIQIGTLEAQTTSITVVSPITSLTVDPTDPLIAGSTNTRTITVGNATGIADPGAITFASVDPVVTFGGSTGCNPAAGGSRVTCSGPTITLSISIADKLFSGPLPITVTDAGGRDLGLALNVVTPADLQLSALDVSEPLIAGGGGQLAVTVDNTGGSASSREEIKVWLPHGIKVSGVTAGTTLICTSAVGCELPEIAAGESVSLLLDLQVCQCVGAHPFPPAAVGIAGKSATKQLTVASGIAALTTVPDGPFLAGSKNQLTITATVVGGVSNPGKVTFTSTSKYVTFSDAKNCETVRPPGTGVSAIRCTGTSYPMTITIGRDQKPGDLPVLATDAGGRRLALLDADKVRLRVVAPGRLQLTKFIETRPVSAGGFGLLTLTVSNPNPEPSERMPIAITLTGELRLTYVNGLGHGFISGLCGPLWDTTCQLPSVGKDPVTLTFTVVAPPTARSGTLTVTVDHTTRAATIAVSPAPQTSSAGLTLGLDLLQEPEPPSTEPDQGADATPAPAADPAPPAAETSQTTDGPAAASSLAVDTDAPETTGPAEPTPPTETTAESPATSSPDSTPPGSADPAPSSTPESNTSDGTTTSANPPPSSAAPATAGPSAASPPATDEQSAASPPATTDPAAPGAAQVLLSAPLGGPAVAPGSSSALSFTASNSGDEPSAALPLHFELPDGFDVRSVTVDGSVVCAAGDACALPALKPGADVQVIVEVRVGPGTSGGAVLITVDGSGVGWRLALPTPDTAATAADSAPTDVTARTEGGR